MWMMSIAEIVNMQGCIVASLSSGEPFMTAEAFLKFAQLTPADQLTQQMVDCSEIEILLITCMCLLEDKSLSSYNFRMVFDEYENVKAASVAQQIMIPVFTKELCLRAFESLLEKRLVLPLSSQSNVTLGTAKQYNMVRLPFYYRTRELIKSECKLPLWLNRWLGREFTGK
jgi:origin recognition complex subunit 4